MSKKISFFTLIFAPLLLFGQMQLDSFDSAPADSNYWGHEISENADSTLSFVNVSYITDQVAEGSGAMQLEYSGHNSESWGGYAKIFHYARAPLPPDTTSGGGGGSGPGIMDGPSIVFSGPFGGAEVDTTTMTYTTPTGAEGWAGFANEDTTFYPFSFPGGGNISFMGSTAGTDVEVHFRFEYNPYPDTEPSYNTATVTISGTDPAHYSVDIPPQGENTFSSFLLYVNTLDAPVTLTHVRVHEGVVFSGEFGGAQIDSVTNTYTNPTGAEGWAGFANEDVSLYPFSFPNGGSISFMGSTAGTDADVYFRFEYNPYPDTEPSYNTATVTISGTDPAHYSVDIPPQGENTFSSFLLYVNTLDAPVTLTHVNVHRNPPPMADIVFSGPFGGAEVDTTTMTYTTPTGAEGWAGFANEDASLYPFSFPNGGSISFMGSTAGTDVSVHFRFEYNPYPDTEPSYNTEAVTISGTDPMEYVVDVPSQGENTFSSFLLYVNTLDAPVTLTNVHVHVNQAPALIQNDQIDGVLTQQDWESTLQGSGTTIFSMQREHGELWDWSMYDSISFDYYNSIPASEANRIHLRLNISDYAGVDENYSGLGEYYYSFHYILDSEPGWNTVTMPLVRNDDWNGGGLNLTGWAGDADNYEFDAHAVGGIHLEFSIGGGGEGDHVSGTVILDDLKLVGYKGVDLVIFNGMGTPPGWGNPFAWGGAQMFVTEGGGYIPGTNALTYVQQDAWTGGGFNMAPPVDLHGGGEWLSDSISFWMHSEADAPQLRLQFEGGAGKVGGNFTPVAAGGWNHYKYALKDFAYVDNTTDFDTSAITVFQILSEGNGAAGRTFHFDNMWTGTPDIDVVAPVAPENVSGIPGANFNLVTWTDIDGEEGEMYDVFASMNPITELGVPGVEPIASNVIEGAQTATHYLVAPLEDMNVTYYYAVVCVDAAGNVGALGVTSSPVTNTAKGIPTISLDVPSNFVADGDLSEWADSGIMPFIINPSTGGVWAAVDDEEDLNGTVYLAIDDDYIYFAADVIDDDYHFGEGNWWDQDALQFFFGLYDSRGPKHNSIKRGDEPDYIVYANENTLQLDNPGNVSIGNSDQDHYHFEMFDPDYVVEGKISLDTLAQLSGDPRFHPVNGMKIPLDIYFHDNDNGTWEGNIGYSTLATDQQWNNPEEWSFTWIGDQATILSNDNEAPISPEVFALYQNYPNPFNPVTNIKFSLPENQKVSLGIYSVTGRLVETLVNENRVAGFHIIQWNAGRHASGVYFYRLDAGVNSKTQKMILLK